MTTKPQPVRITDAQLKKIAKALGEPIFNQFVNSMRKEIKRVMGTANISINDYVNIVILTLSSIDGSVLKMVRESYKGTTGQEIDFVKVLIHYIDQIQTILNEDELKRLREKMN